MAKKSPDNDNTNKENLEVYKEFLENRKADNVKDTLHPMDQLAQDGAKLIEQETPPVVPVIAPKPIINENNPYIRAKTHILSILDPWKRGQIERIGRDKLNNVPTNAADDRMFDDFCVNVTRIGNSLSNGEPLPKK